MSPGAASSPIWAAHQASRPPNADAMRLAAHLAQGTASTRTPCPGHSTRAGAYLTKRLESPRSGALQSPGGMVPQAPQRLPQAGRRGARERGPASTTTSPPDSERPVTTAPSSPRAFFSILSSMARGLPDGQSCRRETTCRKPRVICRHTAESTHTKWRRAALFGSAGSSPHARGAHMRQGRQGALAGIIPACAGSTRTFLITFLASQDHPRMRGEHPSLHGVDRSESGSSPHARGALGDVVAALHGRGIIPACAGST